MPPVNLPEPFVVRPSAILDLSPFIGRLGLPKQSGVLGTVKE
jgi:hypothetical protein